jgi:hypothetical protein
MAILRLSIRRPLPCIFAIFKPTIFNLWILIEDYTRINKTAGFFDSLCRSSEIELGLGPSQIKFFKNYISSLSENIYKFFSINIADK